MSTSTDSSQREDVFKQTLGEVLRRTYSAPLQALPRTTIRVYFASLSGVSTTLDVEPTISVMEFRRLVAETFNLPPEKLKLTFGGRSLLDNKTLDYYDIGAWTTVFEECLDIPALIELYKSLKGDEWLSSHRAQSNKSLVEEDKRLVAEREGSTEVVTDEETRRKRYVHSSKQANFDRQSLPECRHLLPTAWPKDEPVGIEIEYEVPGGVLLLRNEWKVTKAEVLSLKKKSNLAKGGEGGGETVSVVKIREKEGKKGKKKFKAAATATAATTSSSAEKTDEKDKGGKKKKGKKGKKGKKNKGLEEVEEEVTNETSTMQTEEKTNQKEEESQRGVSLDPLVDHHSPAKWFGVGTAIRHGLLRVTSLNLSRNSLSGFLPHEALGKLSELETIDFSYQTFKSVRPPEHETTVESRPLKPQGALSGSLIPPKPKPKKKKKIKKAKKGESKSALSTSSIATFDSPLAPVSDDGTTVDGNSTIQDIDLLSLSTVTSDLMLGSLDAEVSPLSSPHLHQVDATTEKEEEEFQPSLLQLQNLKYLDLSNNILTGPLPGGQYHINDAVDPPELLLNKPLGWMCAPVLQELCLQNNRLTGEIPQAMSEFVSLSVLRLEGNQLNGCLSAELFKSWPQLVTLKLSGNQFTGLIPNDLGISCPLLEVLSLERNQFSGGLPMSLGHCLDIQLLSLGKNRTLTGKLPIEAWLNPIPCSECSDSTAPTTVYHSRSNCNNARCKSGFIAPFSKLLSLGLQGLPRILELHECSSQLQLHRPLVQVYVEPFLPRNSVEKADQVDAENERLRQEEERIANEEEAAFRADDDALLERIRSNAHIRSAVVSPETIKLQQEEEARRKAEEEEAIESANDSETTAAWRKGSANGNQEDTLQLAIAYELGLFGLKRNVKRAIKLLKLISPESELEPLPESEKYKRKYLQNMVVTQDDSDDNKTDNEEEEEKEEDLDENGLKKPKRSEIALKELQRLEAEELNKFVKGGDKDQNYGEYEMPDDNWGLEDDTSVPTKGKAIKVDPNPYMTTFSTSIYSVALESLYERKS